MRDLNKFVKKLENYKIISHYGGYQKENFCLSFLTAEKKNSKNYFNIVFVPEAIFINSSESELVLKVFGYKDTLDWLIWASKNVNYLYSKVPIYMIKENSKYSEELAREQAHIIYNEVKNDYKLGIIDLETYNYQCKILDKFIDDCYDFLSYEDFYDAYITLLLELDKENWEHVDVLKLNNNILHIFSFLKTFPDLYDDFNREAKIEEAQ